jgi:hypothetical protein
MQYIVKEMLTQVSNYAYSPTTFPKVMIQLPDPSVTLELGSQSISGIPVEEGTYLYNWNYTNYVDEFAKVLTIGDVFDFPIDQEDLALTRTDPSSCRNSYTKYLFICKKI